MDPNFVAAYNRSPAWKWNRAQSIVDGTGPASTDYWDTAAGSRWINRAAGYIESYHREPDPVRNNELIVLYADIYGAHSMYTDDSTHFREELEAMILARVETEVLAQKIDVPVATIRAYEELFFDVRGKLETAESYILNFVIGPEIQRLSENTIGPLWKLFGYYQGPEVLKALISRTINPNFAAAPDDVAARLNEDINGSFKIACAIAAKKPAGGDRRDRDLLQLFTKIMEVDKMEDMSSGSAKGQIAAHVGAVVSTLNLSVGGSASGHSALPAGSGEPQFSELVSLAFTGTAPSYETTKDFTFPTPN